MFTETARHCTVVLSIILLLVLDLLIPVTAANTFDDVQQRIEQTEEQLRSLKQDIATSEQLRQELQQSVDNVLSKVGEREHRLQTLDASIKRYNEQLSKLDAQLQNAKQDIQSHKSTLALSLKHMQNLGKHSELKLILQHDDPELGQRLKSYSDYFLATQKRLLDSQVAYLSAVSTSREKTLENRNWLNHIRRKADRQRENLELEAAEEIIQLSQLKQSLKDKQRSVSQLEADQERLQSLIDELRLAQLAQSGYFEAGKGSYKPPVKGELTERFGDVKSVGKLLWNGWFIQAPTNSPVQAVADGEIVYANWLEGFGMLVIVDHGDGYMSLYGGNRTISATIGDWVQSGATIATVGDSGGQSKSGLYFEIRKNAKAMDPEHWISADVNL